MPSGGGTRSGRAVHGFISTACRTHTRLAHQTRRPLSYIGYGGTGKQVRDVLHVDDLVELIDEQLIDPDRWDGVTVNVGGTLGGKGAADGRSENTQASEAVTVCA